jgi:hypothetical protein
MDTLNVNLILVLVGGVLTIAIFVGFWLSEIKQRVNSRAEQLVVVQVKTNRKHR